MNILSWILFGLIVGVIANLLEPYPYRGGLLGTILIGVLGSLVGGFLGELIFGIGVNGFSLYSFIVAAVGAVTIIALARTFRRI